MILSYANGYGYYEHLHPEPYNETDATLERLDLSEQDYTGYRFISPAAVPMKAGSETHSGADVGIFASGTFHGKITYAIQNQTIFYFRTIFPFVSRSTRKYVYLQRNGI